MSKIDFAMLRNRTMDWLFTHARVCNRRLLVANTADDARRGCHLVRPKEKGCSGSTLPANTTGGLEVVAIYD